MNNTKMVDYPCNEPNKYLIKEDATLSKMEIAEVIVKLSPVLKYCDSSEVHKALCVKIIELIKLL